MGRTLFWRHPRRWLLPLNYVRTRELPGVVDLVDPMLLPAESRVLDIASPQMLTVYLAGQNPLWSFDYLNSFAPELAEMQLCAEAARLKNVRVCEGDARDTKRFASSSFDLILSSSVLEHVEDREGLRGDSVAMQNIARWLRPGGQAVLSVPYARQSFEEFTTAPVYRQNDGAAPSGKVFFQRFYDAESLQARLIVPSGLVAEAQSFLGERHYHPGDSRRRLAVWLARLGRGRFLVSRFYPLLAAWFMEKAADPARLCKPYIAVLRLRRP